MSKPIYNFLDLPELKAGEIYLQLKEKRDAVPEKGYVPAYIFDVMSEGVDRSIGYIDLRLGDNDNLRLYGGHIGYGVDEEFRKQGIATKALKLVLKLAKLHQFQELWITCRPDNTASRRVLEKAGGEYVNDLEIPLDHEMREEEGRTHGSRFVFKF